MDEEQRKDPDLPADLEEPTAPATPSTPSLARRLLMSRELRGWMVGLSALAVAVAAVAPGIDTGQLTGALSLADAGDKADELTCQAQDQTGGFGGQKVGCSFTCPENPGWVSVRVDADDADAQVSGDATCNTDNAHCSGRNMCSQTEERTGTGRGTCKADSDEAIDSGLYVECTADEKEIIDGTPGPDNEICVVHDPVPVCIQPACAMLAAKQQATCQKVWELMVGHLTPTTNMVAFLTGEDGAGLGCQGFICVPFEPVCVTTKAGGQTCFAP